MAKSTTKTPVTNRGWLGSSSRTPWGRMPRTSKDETARDPFEPDAPLSPEQAAAMRIGPSGQQGASPSAPANPNDPAPLTPRELFELLMSPPAMPSRSSPVRQYETAAATDEIPAEIDMIRSAIEAGQAGRPPDERRSLPRRTYRVKAGLRLHSDPADAPLWTLFTRDVHARGLGFITRHRLPLGYSGTVELPNPDAGQEPLRVTCTVLRCREASPGWFEGSLYFTKEVPQLNLV